MILKNKVVVIPAYNEEKTLENIIFKIKNFADVIVVNDGSTDKTLSIAKKNNVRIINHHSNLGYDKSISDGLHLAQKLDYKFIVTIDADNQHDVQDIKVFFNLLEFKEYKLIVGTRKITNRMSENLLNFFIKIFFGINDLLCGLKGYDVSIIRKYNNTHSKNMIGTLITLKSIRNKENYSTRSISVSKRLDSPRFGSPVIANFRILQLLVIIFFLYVIKKI